jgi:hypothetical protein
MSYTSDSVKEFILGVIDSNILIPDCLNVIYNKIVENIITKPGYNTFKNAVSNKATLFEIQILYKHNIIDFCMTDINMLICEKEHNHITKYIYPLITFSKRYIDININAWLHNSIFYDNVEIYDYIYNMYINEYPNIKETDTIVNNYIYTAIRKDNINTITYFKNKGFDCYLTNISCIVYDNLIIKMFDSAIKYDIKIFCDNYNNIINQCIELNRFNNIKNLDYIYNFVIKPNVSKSTNNNYYWFDYIIETDNTWLDNIISYAVQKGNIDIYNWIKENNLSFSLKKDNLNEYKLLNYLNSNYKKNKNYYKFI